LAFGVSAAIVCLVPSHIDAAAEDAGVTWLIFVDDLHLDFLNTGRVRMLLRSIASELVRDGDAFVLRSSGPSPSLELTTDRSALNATIGRIAGNSLQPAAILRLSVAYEIQDEVRHRASVARSAAIDALNAASSPSRRRVMLYVSNGYLDPPDGRVAELARAARRSDVTVFAMNAGGLPSAPAVLTPRDALWDSYRAAMVDSLRAISEPTGGFAVLDAADFADALPRISRMVR
jgi:hypothetical protein